MIELLRKRRSIRAYTDRPIKPEHMDLLQEALLRSPTSRNLRPWRFIFIENTDLLEKLSRCKPHGASFLAGARLGIVILGDETISDVWVEDCAIASILAQLTAQSLGLGSCWIQIRKRMYDGNQSAEQYIQSLLDLPEHLRVESIIALGYPAETKTGIAHESLDRSRIGVKR
ncbi:MAG TPA: NAD(P)H-dependent dehydrogenase/reductase [bacterium]|nr:NAD(P)H-dependent dehydrogenase/reductase [bacterium]